MPETLTEKVDFGIIRYANCWEDADILLEGLSPAEGNRILSIGSAGDNSFSLLVTKPELVIAVDVNSIQLYLIELKKACIKHLNYEEALAFLGFTSSSNRSRTFHLLKHELSPDARAYWEANLALIEKGIIYSGKFENYFGLFCRKVLPWIHTKKTIAELFRKKFKKEQEDFYNKTWNSWRWKLLFKIFFSRYVMGKFGRDPAFLNEVKIPVADYIYGKAAAQLKSVEAQHNFMLHFTLTGTFGNLYPHYMRRENYEIIQQNIDRLHLHKGYAEDAIHAYGKFDCMNLSNIFEYMNESDFAAVVSQLVEGIKRDGKLAYWNLMVDRRISSIMPAQVAYEEGLSARLTNKDKGFFYKHFIVDKVR